MTLQSPGDAGGGEWRTEDFRGQGLPGGRRGGLAFIQADAAEHAEVAEDEGGRFGVEDEVVVGRGRVIRRAGEEFAGHAEVAAQPEAAREFEEHVFPVGAGAAVGGAGQRGEGGRRGVPEKSWLRPGVNAENFLAEARIPLGGVIGDFC